MKANIVQKIIYILLILFCVGFYIYQVVVQKVDPSENLGRFVLVVAAAVIGLVRSNYPRRRGSLELYEKSYAKELGDAFATEENERKNLIRAARFYDENNFKKSVNLLMDLKNKCKHADDYFAVSLFLALNFTDMCLYEEAINEYEQILSRGMENGTIYNNLGHIYLNLGKKKEAMEYLEKSATLPEQDGYAYANLANLHFEEKEFDAAIEYATKALEINSKLNQSASLLAIIYALQEDKENTEKYFHKAVACGSNPKDLKQAIEWYQSNK